MQPPSSDLMDEQYERSFSDPPEEVLSQLNNLESARIDPMAAACSTPLSTTHSQAIGAVPPGATAAVGTPPDGSPIGSPTNDLSPSKSRFRRQSAPPAEITSTRLRPKITPSKYRGSEIADRANARRTQPPKSPSPSLPIPSQLLAMSLASSTTLPSNKTSTKAMTDDDPFKSSEAPHPPINHGPYPYSHQYPPPQRMVSPYANSYPQLHGFLPMNAAQYGPGQYDHHSQYGDVTNYGAPGPGVRHGSIPLTSPGYPHFPPLPAKLATIMRDRIHSFSCTPVDLVSRGMPLIETTPGPHQMDPKFLNRQRSDPQKVLSGDNLQISYRKQLRLYRLALDQIVAFLHLEYRRQTVCR